tara:strand:- start:3741 stop:4367 length:627 start_codon:yes stop_codon:yes gene_type:complete
VIEPYRNNLIRIDKHWTRFEIVSLSSRYDIKTFIETGTHIGETILAMSQCEVFDQIHTIEISPDAVEFLKTRFVKFADSQNISLDNVVIYHGDSTAILPEILTKDIGRSFFWLDAHYSGEGSGKKENENCTILKELESLKTSPIKDHVIGIDDIDQCVEKASDYPSLEEIEKAIYSINKDYSISIKYNVLWAEVPSSLRRFHPKRLHG